MIYDEIVEKLHVKKGESIWLSSELIRLAVICKKGGVTFDASRLINAFVDALGENGTLIIPTFSFDFTNKHYYDICNTKGVTGALGNVALGRPDFKRTSHPVHSFAVWGRDAEMLCLMSNSHSFGADSPFEYCVSNKVHQIILGTDYCHSMTFIHYAETTCGVPYRFSKTFTGTYISEDGRAETRNYDYAARRLEIEPKECFNRIGAILESNGVSEIFDMDGYICYRIDLAASYPIVCNDIKNNMCGNIYDFNIEREKVFTNWREN